MLAGGYVKNKITLWDWAKSIRGRHLGCPPYGAAAYTHDPALSLARLDSRWRGPGWVCGYLNRTESELAEGTAVRLRVELAQDVLCQDPGMRRSRLAGVIGYYTDDDCQDELMQPIVVRLPRRRGFLAGYTLGGGMSTCVQLYLFDDIVDAVRAAHDMAEYNAEEERRYQARCRREEDALVDDDWGDDEE